MAKQISVFLENKCGSLGSVAGTLGKHGINIRGLSITDTSDFGILRLIVDQPAKACAVLREEGFMTIETEVIAVQVPDRPGGLAEVLSYLEKAGINIEYLYAFITKPASDALIILRVENIPEALKVLSEHKVAVIEGDRIYSL